MSTQPVISEMHDRIRRLERRARVHAFIWISIVSLGAVALASGAQPAPGPQDIAARSLTIVDEAGAQRILISADLPSEFAGSRTYANRTQRSGVAIFDANERIRAGLGVLDDGSALTAFYDERGERMQLFAFPDGRSGLLMQDPGGAFRIFTGVWGDETRIRYQAKRGNPRIDLRVNEADGARIELFDENGELTSKQP